MTRSSTQGITSALHPVSDLATAKAVAYWHVPDMEAKLPG